MTAFNTRRRIIRTLLLCALFALGLASQSVMAGKEHVKALDRLVSSMQKYYWDTGYKGLDWNKLVSDTKIKVEAGEDLQKSMAPIGDLLEALKDHHTRLELPETDDMGAADIYGGIGCTLQLKTKEGYCLISEVFEGSPAEGVGLKAGDRIWAVDGKSVEAFVADKKHPVDSIRGKAGTKVLLTVETPGTPKRDVGIERRQIVKEKKATVKRFGVNNEIGYMTWDNFYDTLSMQVLKGLRDLGDTKGLILDLRGDPGGLIRELVQVAGYLGIKDLGWAVSREGTTYYRTMWVPPIYSKPMVILVDGGTASSAEILSTVAKESGRATLVGAPTSNGTAVAISVPIGFDYTASITTAQFFTPKGSRYDKPTKPDIELPLPTEEDLREGKDPWVDKAVEVMQGILGSKSLDEIGKPATLAG